MALNNMEHSASLHLQNVYHNMAQNFELQVMDTFHDLSPCNIDKLVELEMQRLRSTYQMEEERFVEQMLQENPIVVERRCVPKRNELPCTPNATATSTTHERNNLVQQQRAESCRKSRINNKIKKAKTKYRHQYITNKLTQSVNMLECMKDVIAQAEQQLLCSGYTQAALLQLRNAFGMDRCRESLESNMLMPMEERLMAAPAPAPAPAHTCT